MKRYLLDTNIVAFALRGRQEILAKLLVVGADRCAISEVTYAELLYGTKWSEKPQKNRKILGAFVKDIEMVPISNALETFADIKVQLRKMGKLVEDSDIFIGATAIAGKMIMVTENTKHFENMPGIKLENWVER